LSSRLASEILLPIYLVPKYYQNYHYMQTSNFNDSLKFHIPNHSSFYTTSADSSAIPLVSDLVSLPSIDDQVANIPMLSILPAPIAEYYQNINSLFLPK
jgi:hypothetical protein